MGISACDVWIVWGLVLVMYGVLCDAWIVWGLVLVMYGLCGD